MHTDVLIMRYTLAVLCIVCLALAVVQRDIAWLFVIALAGGALRIYALLRGYTEIV